MRGPLAPARLTARDAPPIVLGLRANLGQFLLLVLINGFVGAMVGLERTVMPLIAQRQFGVASASATLSFIVSFGLIKALINFFAGGLSDLWGRKAVLVGGWLVGVPVPLLILWAPAWSWVVAANVLLGVNQALCWSMTINMKIDLVGPARRGLALGLNESAGYGAVGLAALASGALATAYGLRQGPFTLGIAFPVLGLLLSALFVRETRGHMHLEARRHGVPHAADARPSLARIFALASWRDRDLFACSQAGLVNNLNDGLAWGLLPLFFARAGLGIGAIATIAAAYPLSWGVLQLGTGALSDRWGRRRLIVGGMALQGLALIAIPLVKGEGPWIGTALALGLGTALVYPTLLAVVGDVAHPSWRASAVGVYRLWRDLGYAVGALLAGAVADLAGIPAAILTVAALTLTSSAIAAWRLRETAPLRRTPQPEGSGSGTVDRAPKPTPWRSP
ncbi:MAG TPA: MFS transporter [Chloroflexota bacterium]|nr:MFS transporter [Chloroflexota bacterium]